MIADALETVFLISLPRDVPQPNYHSQILFPSIGRPSTYVELHTTRNKLLSGNTYVIAESSSRHNLGPVAQTQKCFTLPARCTNADTVYIVREFHGSVGPEY